jgi:hypothetical protein
MAASKAKIGAGIADTGHLVARPSGPVILRFVPAPTITRTFLAPVLLSPPTHDRLRTSATARQGMARRRRLPNGGRRSDSCAYNPAESASPLAEPAALLGVDETFAAQPRRVGEVRARCREFVILRLQFGRYGDGTEKARRGRWLVGRATRNL